MRDPAYGQDAPADQKRRLSKKPGTLDQSRSYAIVRVLAAVGIAGEGRFCVAKAQASQTVDRLAGVQASYDRSA